MNNPTDPISINNAGMVLLHPFITRLFSMLGLIENNKFTNKDAQTKAIYVLQYAIFEKIDFPEHELVLNKIFTGMNTLDAVSIKVELSKDEKEMVNSMLNAFLQSGQKLNNTSIRGLQEAFLQRKGKLEEKSDHFLLTVEKKPYDVLLDTIPWGFRAIKLPWMDKKIDVLWR